MQTNDFYQRYLVVTRFAQAAAEMELSFAVNLDGVIMSSFNPQWHDLDQGFTGYLYDIAPNFDQYSLTPEQREELAEALLMRFPELSMRRENGGIGFAGVMNGLRVEIDLGRGICEQVVVGTRIVPATPAVEEHEEPIYEYRCIDPVVAALAAKDAE